MTTLYVAWQAGNPSRAWFPIGRLDAETAKDEYVFRYTQGALRARESAGFEPLVAFPNFDRRYESNTLFPLFTNRVLDPARKDFAEYLGWLALDPASAGPIEILGLTGGERQTDSLEVFPKVNDRPDGGFSCRFFLHGLRHVSEGARKRAELLQTDEPLQVAIEVNNPASGRAVQLQTADGHVLGWAPRYLVHDLCAAIAERLDIEAKVTRINRIDAPAARRILVELHGRFSTVAERVVVDEYEVLVA